MFQANQQIGGYTLINKIGRGGFGEVWLAEKRSQFVTKKVAIKLPLDEQVNFAAIRQEATLWEQASGHPNILPIIDADIYGDQVVIVSEYAEGGSLADKIKTEGKLSFKQVVEITVGVLNGLGFLHSKNIIHRDIKPQNILLQGDTPRLADFGISRAMNTSTMSSTIVGTDAYMSPESFQGKRSVQTDIWSVGILLYALLTDNLPFGQEHPSERMFAILMNEPEPLSNEVPQKLREIVHKALAKLPENRYQSAREMSEDLQKIILNISHPTFAKTEVLEIPLQIIRDEAQTIEDRSIMSEQKNFEVLPTELQKIPETPKPMLPTVADPPVGRPLFNRTTDDNNQQLIGKTGFNLVPPTVSSLTPESGVTAFPMITDPPAKTSKWTTKRIVRWIFYFLTPGIGLLTYYVSFRASSVLLAVILFNVIGFLLGYIFPEGKWKWGWLLNLLFASLIIFNGRNDPAFAERLILPLILTTTVTAISYLGAWIKGKIYPPLENNLPRLSTLATKNEWTSARIVRWISYFLAPVIGYLAVNLTNIHNYNAFETIFAKILLILSIIGGFGVLLGFLFPQEKWRWGLWLNILGGVTTIGTIMELYRFDPLPSSLLLTAGFIFTILISCATSYLGSLLALRRNDNREN